MNFFGRATKRPAEQIETVLGPSTNLRGTLRSDGGIRIDGAFEGVIQTAGNLIVGQDARVAADITARNVTVGGVIKGNIDANGCLEILSTGVVYGDVTVDAVMIDEGGQFHGGSRMRVLAHPALAAPVDDDVAIVPPAGEDVIDVDLDLDVEPLEGTARPADEPEPEEDEVPEEVLEGKVVESPTAEAADAQAAGDDGARETAEDAEAREAPKAKKGGGSGESSNGVSESILDDDFDLDGIEMDIEPVIPDLEPKKEEEKPKRKTTRRRSSRRSKSS